MRRPEGEAAAEPWANKDTPALALARRAAGAVLPADLRFRLYFTLLRTPGLSELYVRSRGRLRHRRLQPGTQVVVEAFPSSGSTYCRQALLLANPRLTADAICSHTHSPRVVLRAQRAGVPCLVIARSPRDAVASTVQRFPGVHVHSAFAYYEEYYRRLVPLRERIVLVRFADVVEDFSSVVAQLNTQYGRAFTTPREAGLTTQDVLRDIDDRSARKHGGQQAESKISRPSASRR